MVIGMQTVFRYQISKLTICIMLVLFVLLSLLVQSVQAAILRQTIPTAPPTFVASPTVAPNKTPTNPPQPTEIYTQPTQILPSQTADLTISPTVTSTISSPSNVPTATELSGNGTIPVMAETISPIEATRSSLSSSPLPTNTVLPISVGFASKGLYYFLFAGGLVILLAIVVAWFLKSRRK
jgi:hypothetical protein